MADYCMYFETVIRGYHAYKEDHELTLGEIHILESDAAALTYDKFALKFVTADGKTVGHVANTCQRYISNLWRMTERWMGK